DFAAADGGHAEPARNGPARHAGTGYLPAPANRRARPAAPGAAPSREAGNLLTVRDVPPARDGRARPGGTENAASPGAVNVPRPRQGRTRHAGTGNASLPGSRHREARPGRP